jgi:molybdate transport system substrate-binding protein
VRFCVVLVTGFLTIGCSGPASSPSHQVVRVAAAADLRYAFDDLATKFRETHPDIAVLATYGSSGNFFAQLLGDAPFDLFLSADVGYPRKLIEQGRGVKDSLFVYAVGHLVIWTQNDSKLDVTKLGLRAVTDPMVRKIAIANPRHAPYGRAAEAALKHAGVYDQVKDRLVLGDNVAQTAQFVESGAAEIGLISLSLAMAPPLRDRGQYLEVPTDAYPRIDQGGVTLTGAKDVAAAQALRDFLTSDDGRAVLDKYGFRRPTRP